MKYILSHNNCILFYCRTYVIYNKLILYNMIGNDIVISSICNLIYIFLIFFNNKCNYIRIFFIT